MRQFHQSGEGKIIIREEEISFYSEYKYWIFLIIILILFTVITFYNKRKKKRANKFKNEGVKVVISDSSVQKKTDTINNVEEHGAFGDKTNQNTKSETDIHSEKYLSEYMPKHADLLSDIDSISKNELNKTSENKKTNKSSKPEIIEEPLIEKITSIEDSSYSKVKSIGYEPSSVFYQNENYNFPLVLMPRPSSKIKFPRKGCSNKKGYTEDVFFAVMERYFKNDFQILNDRHIPSKNGKFVYEPDIVLINEKNGKNIFIDLEIDEPYEAFSRTPTHERGSDNVRNKFFTDRGWIVIRFSEIQIHKNPKECCFFIAKVIATLDVDYEIPIELTVFDDLTDDNSWNSLQSKKWAKQNYREEYLGIQNFGVRDNIISDFSIEVSNIDNLIENEIEDNIEIPKAEIVAGPLSINNHERDSRLRFDPIEHKYFIDGNPDTISASQLISKFFPEFDSEYWSNRKAIERGVEVTEILQEWEAKRVNAANLGTALHEEIENYYNGLPYNNELPEFQHFLRFKERYSAMKPYRSEWRIFDEEYLIAGTIDMVYEKDNNELYMFDWKRSEKVVNAQGSPILTNYDYASGELSHLSDNSYNKYAIQQNIYKYILEKRYNKKITSMNLLILHPKYDTYHHITLPDLTKEVAYIFENSKHYR